jgi:hypothetical protein
MKQFYIAHSLSVSLTVFEIVTQKRGEAKQLLRHAYIPELVYWHTKSICGVYVAAIPIFVSQG